MGCDDSEKTVTGKGKPHILKKREQDAFYDRRM
jgi:hypothetical protein